MATIDIAKLYIVMHKKQKREEKPESNFQRVLIWEKLGCIVIDPICTSICTNPQLCCSTHNFNNICFVKTLITLLQMHSQIILFFAKNYVIIQIKAVNRTTSQETDLFANKTHELFLITSTSSINYHCFNSSFLEQFFQKNSYAEIPLLNLILVQMQLKMFPLFHIQLIYQIPQMI
jgi:hypothetical protein